jgi:hypothetical protein
MQTGGVDLYLYSNTFDDSKTAIAIGNGTSPDVGSSIHGFGNHFENASWAKTGDTAEYIIVNLATPLEQGPFIELYGGQFLNDTHNGTLPQFIDFSNGDTLVIDGVEFSSPYQSVSQLVADNATNPSPSVFMNPVVRNPPTTDCTGCNGGRFYDMPVRAVGLSAASTHNVNWTFGNNVTVNGTLSKAAGSFTIDHPLYPSTKLLSHSFVESPDMMNVYSGNITTNKRGLATVRLPEYFQALNRDFRYQLTVLGGFSRATVLRKIENNHFVIKTSTPSAEVSWQVTAVRQDAYANAHRIRVEEEKSAHDQGSYLHPELFSGSSGGQTDPDATPKP